MFVSDFIHWYCVHTSTAPMTAEVQTWVEKSCRTLPHDHWLASHLRGSPDKFLARITSFQLLLRQLSPLCVQGDLPSCFVAVCLWSSIGRAVVDSSSQDGAAVPRANDSWGRFQRESNPPPVAHHCSINVAEPSLCLPVYRADLTGEWRMCMCHCTLNFDPFT